MTIAAVDSVGLSRHRPFDLGPARPLVEQSPVLARLAAEPRGLRTLDPAQNLFLVAGSDAVASYRTLDLPAPGPLLALARGDASEAPVSEAIRASGVQLRVLDPIDTRRLNPAALRGYRPDLETIRDPTLAGCLFGTDLARALSPADFTLLRPKIDAPSGLPGRPPRPQSPHRA